VWKRSPRPEAALLLFDDEHALAVEHEEVFLVPRRAPRG
jgi:hypothetical protein